MGEPWRHAGAPRWPWMLSWDVWRSFPDAFCVLRLPWYPLGNAHKISTVLVISIKIRRGAQVSQSFYFLVCVAHKLLIDMINNFDV